MNGTIDTLFRVFDPNRAPIATGGFPGGIAIQGPPAPRVVVLRRAHLNESYLDPATGDPNDPLLTANVSLEATDVVHITTRVDSINGDVCTQGGDFYFSVNTKAAVTFKITDLVTGKRLSSKMFRIHVIHLQRSRCSRTSSFSPELPYRLAPIICQILVPRLSS